MKTIRIIVKGHVQGVCFRSFVEKQSVILAVTGFVRNVEDGSVEVIASAEPEKLDALVKQCNKGTPFSKVSEVLVSEYIADEDFIQFDIR